MSIKIVVDMNLPPLWVDFLTTTGWPSVHWSTVGDPRASDREIMEWAASNGFAVFTHDLDFAALLAATHASAPSVLQVRAANVFPEHLGELVLRTLRQHEADLEAGAVVVVDELRSRVRILPMGGDGPATHD